MKIIHKPGKKLDPYNKYNILMVKLLNEITAEMRRGIDWIRLMDNVYIDLKPLCQQLFPDIAYIGRMSIISFYLLL